MQDGLNSKASVTPDGPLIILSNPIHRRLDRAFRLCTPHAGDPALLITCNPEGVFALLSDECKAVHLNIELTPDFQAAIDDLTPAQITALHTNFAQKRRTRFDPAYATNALRTSGIFSSAAQAQLLGDHLENLHGYMLSIVESRKYSYGWFHGHLALTPRYHIDTIPTVRCSTVFRGVRGMRYVLGNLDAADHAIATGRICLDPAYVEAKYKTEELPLGQPIFTKSKKDGSNFGNTQSLGHCSVEEAGGSDRLYTGIDLYTPVYVR